VIQESGGNIGIGKTPEAKLDVNGDLYTNGTSYNFNNVNNRNGYLYFDHPGVQVWKFGLFNDNSSTLSLGNGGNFNRIFNITNNGNIGINDTTPLFTLDVNGTLNATGATTLGSTLAVTGAVTLSTTTATPTSLLGKDGSNVVGTVTTVAQTGLMKAGSVTQNTSSVGIISVAHGLSYEPTQVIVTLAQQNSYIVVCHDITATTLFFTVYDSVTGNPLNNISVGIFWLAIK
jgi:hypothetical protein